MTTLSLHPVAEADAAEVLRFETENRAFFERTLPSMGDAYFTPAATETVLAERVRAWAEDVSYHFLIRQSRELVGRIGLFGVQRGPKQMAEVGYRIAERHSGKGYATQAVGLVLEEAFGTHKLHRVETAISPKNIGSQLVLLKNGFEFWGRSRSSYLLNSVWKDIVTLERHAD